MNNFISGFISGFAVGFFLMVLISVILGILAILSLTMEASDLPTPWFGQRHSKTKLASVFQQFRAIKRWLK